MRRRIIEKVGTAIFLAFLPLSARAEQADYWHTFFEQGQAQLLSKSWQKAEVSFREALRQIKRVPHSTDELVICLVSLADLLELENDREESWKFYNQSLKLLEHQYGKDSLKLYSLLITMGSVIAFDGEPKKASLYFVRAADIARAKQGSTSLNLALALHKLGQAEFHSGHACEAEEYYRAALALMMGQANLPASEPVLALLSDYLDLMHKYTGPTKVLTSRFEKELLKDQVQLLGKTRAVAVSAWQQALHQTAADTGFPLAAEGGQGQNQSQSNEELLTVAQLLSSLPEPEPRASDLAISPVVSAAQETARGQRIDYYERMIAIDTKTLGPGHPSVARDLKGLAAIYVSEHKYSQARPLLERAIAIYGSVYSGDDLSIQRLKTLLKLINEQALDTTGGVVLLRAEAANIPLQAQTFEVAQRLNELAFLAYEQGKLSDARAIYAWALASVDLSSGSRSVFVAACLQDYLLVLRSSGRAEEADQMQALSKSILADSLSAELLQTYK